MLRKTIAITLIAAVLFMPIGIVYAQTASCSSIDSSNASDCCFNNSNTTLTVQIACQNYYSGTSSSSTTTTSSATTPITSTTGLTTGAQYSPEVTLQYGANNSFGGLTFKGVGAALVSCSGFGDVVAGAVSNAFGAVKSAIGGVASAAGSAVLGVADSVGVGGVVRGVGKIFGIGKKTTPGQDAAHPSHVKDDALENKAACLDGIAYVLSQQVLQQITNRTLHWANTGFGGNPLYIRDIDSYLLSLRNQQITSFLQSAQNSDPIFGNAIRSVVTMQVTGRSDGLLNTPLNTPQAQSYASFQNDFNNGGWSALLNPAYNPIGAVFNATDNLSQNISRVQTNSQNELQQGNGFLGMKTCVQYANSNGQVQNSTANGSGLQSSNTPCLKYETVTPGSIVALQVANITNSPVRQAELATQFNEAVGSFFDALLNQLFSRGLSGIKGMANQADLGLDYGGLGSNQVIGTDGQPIDSVNANVADINSIAAKSSGTVDISHPQLLRAVIKTQYDYLNRATDADISMDRLIPELGKLDYCLPGPNPSWQDSLTDNFSAYLDNATANSISNNSSISSSDLSLYDKFSTNNVPVANRTLSITLVPYAKTFLQSVESVLTTDMANKFGVNTLADAYAATTVGQANQDYLRGMTIDAYNEVSSLPTVAQNIANADQQYIDKINATQSNIAQLEAINAQILKIVATAKARYIADQKAAGTPVNQQCIDAAYVIDNSAITGVARQESDVANPIIQQFTDANTYFYNSL